MDMPTPTAGHRRLELLAGTWEGEEVMHPSPWDPKGGRATGHTMSRIALNGFYLISDYTQERDGTQTFAGHGVWSYDPQGDLYTLHWFDSMGAPPEVFTGRFAGEILVVAHGGDGMHARLTYDCRVAGQLTTRMEMSRDGTEWKVFFDGHHTRRQP